jgi:hypothetical protein
MNIPVPTLDVYGISIGQKGLARFPLFLLLSISRSILRHKKGHGEFLAIMVVKHQRQQAGDQD